MGQSAAEKTVTDQLISGLSVLSKDRIATVFPSPDVRGTIRRGGQRGRLRCCPVWCADQECAGPDLSTPCCSATDRSVALLDGGPGGSEGAGTLAKDMGSAGSESGTDESAWLCTLICTCCW